MLIFVRPDETEIIAVGVAYLRIEGAFYCGIGILFFAVRILPGHPYAGHVCCADRAVAGHPCSSFLLACFDTEIGVTGIWWSIPIGWLIADVVGIWCYRYVKGVRGS